jgi:hypothetical protein
MKDYINELVGDVMSDAIHKVYFGAKDFVDVKNDYTNRFMQVVPQWISVSENLPDDRKDYWVISSKYGLCKAWFCFGLDSNTWETLESRPRRIEDVLYWTTEKELLKSVPYTEEKYE